MNFQFSIEQAIGNELQRLRNFGHGNTLFVLEIDLSVCGGRLFGTALIKLEFLLLYLHLVFGGRKTHSSGTL